MITRSLPTTLRSRLLRLQSTQTERGSALFLVLMVTTLLTAIGIFSMHAASLAERAVGFNTRGVKTQYQAEFAARTFGAQLTNRAEAYARMARVGTETDCRSIVEARAFNATLTSGEDPIATHCFSQDKFELHAGLDFAYVGSDVEDLTGQQNPNDELEVAFFTEMTDVYEAGVPIAGQNLAGKLKYYRFTMTAEAQLRPVSTEDASDSAALNASSVQRIRGQGIFGPF